MPPIGGILAAVEIVPGRHPHGLGTPQARAIGVHVPMQRHGADRPPCARGGAVAVAQRGTHTGLRVAPPGDRLRGAVRRRTIIGGGAVGAVATPLQDQRGAGPTEGGGGHAATRRRRCTHCRCGVACETCQTRSTP